MNASCALDAIAASLDSLLSRPALGVALRQRAKFEGWLKIELAAAIREEGASVCLEAAIAGTRHRADIEASFGEDKPFLLMLKTVNTSFDIGKAKRRPMSRNIKKVIEDLRKLQSAAAPCYPLVVFPVFPVSANREKRMGQLAGHLDRIQQKGGHLEREGFVVPPCSDGKWGVSWFITELEKEKAI